jgi:selenium-dependent molybdenum hydroxylase system protein, YqeB family
VGATDAGRPLALIKGAGDLATGVALRLQRSGFAVVMTEIARPTVVRRTVAFAEAVYEGRTVVEGIEGVRVEDAGGVEDALARMAVPVVIDPAGSILLWLDPRVVVDAIVAKRNLGTRITDASVVIALGPGFLAGHDAHAVIETMRGHSLGRVIIEGAALPNTGAPAELGGVSADRVIRSPATGVFRGARQIGDHVGVDEIVGYVGEVAVRSRLEGVLRGLLHPGLEVTEGFKLGDVDHRAGREECYLVSDKAMAIAGGVLEAACGLLGGVHFGRA